MIRRCLILLLLAWYADLTAARVYDWRKASVLWQSAIALSPCLVRPHLELAYAFGREGDGEAAAREWLHVEHLMDGKEPGCAK